MCRLGGSAQIFLGIACGVALGLMLRYWTAAAARRPWTERELMYLQFPGEIFLRLVNCLILPLVVSSVVSASAGLKASGGIGAKALRYYVATTTLGIALSVALSQIVRPGEWKQDKRANGTAKPAAVAPVNFVTVDTILDLMRNLCPDNIIQACISQYQTILIQPFKDAWNKSADVSVYDMGISRRLTPGTNVLGLVFCGLVFGLTLGSMPEGRKEPLLRLFQCLASATAEIVDWVIRAAPIAVIFLISGKILRGDESGGQQIARLGIFVLTVLAGLAIQALLVLPLIYFGFTRRSPYGLLTRIGPALVTAFGTSSSTATVPTTIRCLDQLGVDPQVSRFVVPIGATINMDGIALYETIGALFIMQTRGLDLSLVQTIAISITCTLSCIGAAGMPSGGYAMLIMVLNSLGIPAEDVALIIAVDTFVDRFRTMVNIVADTFGAKIISDLLKKERTASSMQKNNSCNIF